VSVDVRPARPVADRRLDVIVTGLASDAHTWNLVFLELLLEELGGRVSNLGACTPNDTVVRECLTQRPGLLVVGSLNGHGVRDGLSLIGALRAETALLTLPVVIGGKLDTTGGGDGRTAARLMAAGFDAVFEDNRGLTSFRSFVHALTVRSVAPIGAR
jgi:methylaspartate mutase sigma subunit